jgi:transcriptional regulator with XRE-family HTH domain
VIMTLTKKLLDRLRRKPYREAYVEENVRTYVAYQIRALREQRGLTQKQFGELIGKPPSVISRIEDPDYGKLSMQTLLEVAAAFDVALLVQFAGFPEFILRMKDVAPEALSRESFSEAQFVPFETVSEGPTIIRHPGLTYGYTHTATDVRLIGAVTGPFTPVTISYPTGAESNADSSPTTEWGTVSRQGQPPEGKPYH